MSSGGTTQLDHAGRQLSTLPGTRPSRSSELANLVRHRPGARGHVESHFLKANSPDGTRAIWLKFTLLVPLDPAAASLAEVWAIAFADGGRRKLATKDSFPIAQARLDSEPFRIVLPSAELCTGATAGTVGQGPQQIAWRLQLDPSGEAFRPFRHEFMYSGPFPRSKSLTPLPDTRVHGEVRALGETWRLEGWRGAQGHNWGQSHARAYAWLHSNALTANPGGPPLEDTWVEALTGRVSIGRLTTPWLSVAALTLEGRQFRFDGLGALMSRQVLIQNDRYELIVEQAGAQLRAQIAAPCERFAGLRYDDPDGGHLTCLNSKLAEGTITLSYRGQSRCLYTAQAALEIGTREPQHEVPVLV